MHPPVPAPVPGLAYPDLPHEAADPHSLPDSAWLDPASFARTHSTAGICLGIPHYKLEAAPEGAAPGAPGARRRVASAPRKSEAREAKSRRVFIEEAPLKEVPKKEPPQAKVVYAPRVRTVVPKAPLHIARAPPPKRASAALAPEAAAEPDLAADTTAEPNIGMPVQNSKRFRHHSQRVLSPGPGAPTDARFPKKAPPNVVKYKGPPHGASVRGIRSRSPP